MEIVRREQGRDHSWGRIRLVFKIAARFCKQDAMKISATRHECLGGRVLPPQGVIFRSTFMGCIFGDVGSRVKSGSMDMKHTHYIYLYIYIYISLMNADPDYC